MVWGSFSLPCTGILSSYTSVLIVWLFSCFVCSHPHQILEIGLLVFAYLTFHVQCHLCMDRSGILLFPLLTFLIQLVHCTKGVELSHFPWLYTFLGMSLSLWGAPHSLCPVHILHPLMALQKWWCRDTILCTDDIFWPVTLVTPAHFVTFEQSAQWHHNTDTALMVWCSSYLPCSHHPVTTLHLWGKIVLLSWSNLISSHIPLLIVWDSSSYLLTTEIT